MALSKRKAKKVEAQITACAEAIRRATSDAPIRAGSNAEDIGLGGRDILVTLTDWAVYWALFVEPGTVMSMWYDRISDVQQDGGVIRLTARDPEYAASLNDPSNPFGETDFVFRLPDSEHGHQVSQLLNLALFKYSPVFSEKRGRLERFKLRQGTPVSSWSTCPYCESELSSKVEGAVVCSVCQRCFCDPDLEPILSEEPQDYGRATGVKPWPVLFEAQLVAKGKTNTWLYRPQGGPGPMVVWDLEPFELMDKLPT